ncbi:DUF1697 domain-containing protein [Microbacterium hominis]|uniref:DUF1697 domain-containing protein n=1 Tax=Microbacterium TaxID=33882 RepID=UPI00168AE124|nr:MULTISPECIES: DUF1697 domain-containing protein [Microbacterium]QOC25574.1 DUF1697 domain-containing protein [Microbacterium hominis]QOC29576.1 DUF1697 domain-containing protein [Microbacterium hominis]QRY41156.1 DUF1697 domain-containing protein [Microbacterium hominis]QYF98052.1 DUF1697 domain-containing protein [Microbacterium sp. PAMC21962]
MTTWVALLRGVNVNGITIRSADLAALLRRLGFDDVKTVLASGNARFSTDVDVTGRADLKARIEAALREQFDYDAWIVLITLDELEAATTTYPFDADDETRQPYVVFCSELAVRDALVDAAASLDPAEDPTQPGFGVVYWSPEKGRTLDTPFGRLLGRSEYKPTTTTRNLRTLVKILR